MEFFNSLFKSINERLTSPLYWALLIATVIWNYDIFLTIFFVDNEAILKVTKDEFMKSTYIHDYLFTNVPVVWNYFYQNLPYLYSWFYRVIPVFILTWLFITQVPKIANKAHEKEREFMQKREEKNIDYEEKVVQYKLQNSVSKDALLEKEERDENRVKEVLRLKKENLDNSRKVNEDNWGSISSLENTLSPSELKKYYKIVNDITIRDTFIKMLKYIHKDNEKDDSIVEELWIWNKIFKQFEQFSSNNLISYQYVGIPIWENESKRYLYFEDFWKKIAFQMVQDGYLKEEDLEWKI